MGEDWLFQKWKGWQWVVAFFLISTLSFLMGFSLYFAEYHIYRPNVPITEILVNESTGSCTGGFIIMPLLILFLFRFPMHRSNCLWTVPLYAVAFTALGMLHTTLMSITRGWLYSALHLGRYEPGNPFYRYLMEWNKQVLTYTLIAIIVYFFHRIRAARVREREAAELALRASKLQTQLSEARLKALQGQLQPHFLFNTLNMISSYMYEDVAKADRMIAQLSTLLRMSLETSDRPSVPLHKEMDILGVYIKIMEARFGSRLHFEQEMEPELSEAPVPALLLQPLVENAIRHGEPDPNNTVTISVRAKRNGDKLLLTVADNGPGLNGDTSVSEGLGLRSIRDRLEELYGDRARLTLKSNSSRGLLVNIELPLALPEGMPKESAPSEKRESHDLARSNR